MTAMIQCNGISKAYGNGPLAHTVLKDVSLCLEPGETCAIVGPSGSGKSTLLSILGCLLTPSAGELCIGQRVVNHGSPGELSVLRRTQIGFVFQNAQLLSFLTVRENLQVVAQNAGMDGAALRARMDDVMERLGVRHLQHGKPAQASGGERQRVAIARAMLASPPIILADEPTASLDAQNGVLVTRLLIEQAKREGALLVVVTHDTRIVGMFQRVFMIDSGRLSEQ
jgi:putative ABC transport system ATP-binding protein